jgi:hypothetical protein
MLAPGGALFQHPCRRPPKVQAAPWPLKRVQGDDSISSSDGLE